ncbi:hypothetical protein DUI87_13073 [Hirundo rustica rustica]|uniref:Integrase catalytic domain-containing protein n=1 Tax=Hirundo rustica rustica TaxID=333673 RepID=A0A3M0KCM9_HIRRU|nr:hypothetical protein DUI87_13073 [Hirundo rustica rustica]
MLEATTGWLETYPVPHATARNTILGLEKQILWRHGTPERTESDNGTHFKNSLINTWAREHGIEWVYHIPCHAPAAGKVERCNGLLKTTLKALGGGTFKNWEINLAKATWHRFPDPLYYYPPQILHIDSVILLMMIPIGILQRPLGVC